jgi:sulfur transfer protein SufE
MDGAAKDTDGAQDKKKEREELIQKCKSCWLMLREQDKQKMKLKKRLK